MNAGDAFPLVLFGLLLVALFFHGLCVSADSEAVTVHVDVSYAGGDHEVRRASVPWSWFVAVVDKHVPERHPLRAFLARAHAPGRTWTVKNSSGCVLVESDSPTPATYWATGDAGRALYAKCVDEINAVVDADAARRRRGGACGARWARYRAWVARAKAERPRPAHW